VVGGGGDEGMPSSHSIETRSSGQAIWRATVPAGRPGEPAGAVALRTGTIPDPQPGEPTPSPVGSIERQ